MADIEGISFPEGLTDARGRRLRPGSVVRVRAEPTMPVAEVIGATSDGKVMILTDDEEPEVLVIDPSMVLVVAEVLRDPATTGEFIVQGQDDRCALLLSVGTQDVQRRQPQPTTPLLPDPLRFASERETSTRVDARNWGAAILERLEGLTDEERNQVLFRELDAPILRRVIEEAAIPMHLDRIVLIATDQVPPHRDDTLPFARILQHWVEGASLSLSRQIDSEARILTLHQAPHIVSAVAQQVGEQLRESVAGCSRLVVVAAGGTPAMTYGALFAAMASGIPVRHLQVPLGQPVIEVEIDNLIPTTPRSGQGTGVE